MGFNPSSATVGTSSTLIAAANPRRRALVIINDSENVIYLARGQAAVSGQGERLNVGASYEADPLREGLPIDAMYGISSASSNVTVQEQIV